MKFLKRTNKHLSNNFAVIGILLTIAFVVSFKFIFPVDFNSNQGIHSWLSASTIKFVNNWLAETPQKFHFVNFESPDSIEFNELSERGPYVSYPSGETLFVYIGAKLCGKNSIDIQFLKCFQLICYWSEVLLFAFFVFRFLERIGVESQIEKSIVTLLTAGLWMWIPINVWYLANIYFADQCIILFVMAFLLVEYESYWCEKKSTSILLNAVKSILIFSGVLIDYYFWILAFVAFGIMIARCVKSKVSFSRIILNSLWYVIPVILAVAFFAYQLFSIPKWNEILKDKFLFRAGIAESEYNTKSFIGRKLVSNFIYAFGLKNLKQAPSLLLPLWLFLQFSTITHFENRFWKKIKKALIGNNGAIILLGFLSPVLQVAFLRNHSAIHEFSMMKLGWICAMLPVIISALINKVWVFESNRTIKVSSFLNVFIISFLSLVILTGIPFSSRDFYKDWIAEYHDYRLCYVLRENTSYEHVCFSFSHEIPDNPPQELAVSKKRVYKINCIEDINTKFPNLKPEAKKILIIEKDSDISDEQKSLELALMAKNIVVFEDDSFCILQLENLDVS